MHCVKTASSYVNSFLHNTGMWQTDRSAIANTVHIIVACCEDGIPVISKDFFGVVWVASSWLWYKGHYSMRSVHLTTSLITYSLLITLLRKRLVEKCTLAMCVVEGVVKSRDDDDDDDVFVSTAEDLAVPSVTSVDSKRRCQSLSALNNDISLSQASDVVVSDVNCYLSLFW